VSLLHFNEEFKDTIKYDEFKNRNELLMDSHLKSYKHVLSGLPFLQTSVPTDNNILDYINGIESLRRKNELLSL
jgi:phospholipid N-methyltransferase